MKFIIDILFIAVSLLFSSVVGLMVANIGRVDTDMAMIAYLHIAAFTMGVPLPIIIRFKLMNR